MKIFIVGLSHSGRTTVSQALAEKSDYQYIDAMSWVRSNFRELKSDEHPHQYEDEYQQYLTKRMQVNPWFVSDYVFEMMKVMGDEDTVYVIDGISSPRDLTVLFDYRKDVIIFLNRIDNDHEVKDHDTIAVSVMRDYCFWMSSAGLLTKDKWLEYNFRIPGESSDHVKAMGAQNSVYIVKSFRKVISHIAERIMEIT